MTPRRTSGEGSSAGTDPFSYACDRSEASPAGPAGVLADQLRGLLDAGVDAVEVAVLVTGFAAPEQHGCGAVLILVGPHRWHPSRRGRVVDAIRDLGATLGIDLDVYPIRPGDISESSVSRNAVIARWMEIGTPIYRSGRP